jgi:hypothetical protein
MNRSLKNVEEIFYHVIWNWVKIWEFALEDRGTPPET